MKKLVLLLTVMLALHNGYSQFEIACGCDYTIAVSEESFDASSVAPGKVICIDDGYRESLKITNVEGTPSNPILIKNCGGDAIIGDGVSSGGLLIQKSKYFKLTGGSFGVGTYGIKINGGNYRGLTVNKGSSNFEIDHIQITNVKNAPAVKIGDNPDCTKKYNAENFSMDDCSLYDLKIEDCDFGILIGHAKYNVGINSFFCGRIYPHGLKNLSIKNSIIKNIASGYAIACYGTQGVFHGNRIENTQTGFKIGTHSNLYIFENRVVNTSGHGLECNGSDFLDLQQNLFANNGGIASSAIAINYGIALDGFTLGLNMVHNTIVGSGKYNLEVEDAFLISESGAIKNNLFCQPDISLTSPYDGAPYVFMAPSPSIDVANNVYGPSMFDFGFENPFTNDFRLQHSSPAINQGTVSGLIYDLDNNHRNLAGAPDAGCFEYRPERIGYFDQIPLKGLYVDGFKDIIGNYSAETELLNFAKDEGFNYLVLYNLAYIHANLYDLTTYGEAVVLASFIERAKKEFGIVQVAAVGEKDASFDKIEAFNDLFSNKWVKTIDVLNLEFEFWANEDSDVFAYYADTYLTPGGYPLTNEGAFDFYMDQLTMIDSRADEMGVMSEIYLGKFDLIEGLELSENVDRILLHYYRTSDVYLDGSSIYNYNSDRIKHIGLSIRKPAVMPIFSNREYHMGPWLLTHDMDQVMETWMSGIDAYEDDFSPGVQDLNIAGHQWYRYTSFEGVEGISFQPHEAKFEIDQKNVHIIKPVDVNQIVVDDLNYDKNVQKALALYDLNGKLISVNELIGLRSKVNFNVSSGMYICTVSKNNMVVETKRVVFN